MLSLFLSNIQNGIIVLLVVLVVIAFVSLFFTHREVRDLRYSMVKVRHDIQAVQNLLREINLITPSVEPTCLENICSEKDGCVHPKDIEVLPTEEPVHVNQVDSIIASVATQEVPVTNLVESKPIELPLPEVVVLPPVVEEASSSSSDESSDEEKAENVHLPSSPAKRGRGGRRGRGRK